MALSIQDPDEPIVEMKLPKWHLQERSSRAFTPKRYMSLRGCFQASVAELATHFSGFGRSRKNRSVGVPRRPQLPPRLSRSIRFARAPAVRCPANSVGLVVVVFGGAGVPNAFLIGRLVAST
ncbi:hypothetical protein HPB50_010693 [Hyalomma asiaticum]|uniref:Uncharacterized protein n=1 Tax=Hyalomma asiaticum TaxID=266040 RepID=A0ACB7SCM6_HYAAI|nr:hypothetical protein HPB50_010693 [Hyalomma asiaticum]